MVALDAAGRLVSWKQVLDLETFHRILIGTSQADLLRQIGHPASKMPIPRQRLVVWNYRYPTHECLWYQFSISEEGKVVESGGAIDPMCDDGPRSLR